MVLDRTKFIREWAKYSKSVVSDSDCKKICNLKGLDDDMFQVVVDVFWHIDADRSGSISADELEKGLACVGFNQTKAQYQQRLKKFDVDNNGMLDLVEFARLCQDCMADCSDKTQREKLLTALKTFDKKNVGYLTAEQVVQILAELGNEKIGLEDAKIIVKEADKNKDGKLQIEEFADFLLQDSPVQKKGGKK
ncbi:neo-calmodulin-like [Convolutriloba macropyga]|uniref:neo-calmodulin-like n=1 Tax=Convolutriloba macropyga TaxID=536237 RepID=UPI003F524BEA